MPARYAAGTSLTWNVLSGKNSTATTTRTGMPYGMDEGCVVLRFQDRKQSFHYY